MNEVSIPFQSTISYPQVVSEEFHIKAVYAENVLKLIDEGNTIPFIARYRKEQHGTLDDQILREISERYEYLQNLEKRKGEVYNAILAQDKLTEEISSALTAAKTLAEVEDIYRPYKQKRRTRASVAKEKGLEPLALAIFAQERGSAYPIDMAAAFVDAEKGVETPEDALKGALDIIAEMISDNASIRKRLRIVSNNFAVITSKAADADKDSVYANYYDFSEPVKKIAGHRILAIDRGEREDFLKVSIDFETAKAMQIIYQECVSTGSPCTYAVEEAAHDAYERLIFPSLERELRSTLTERACTDSIKVFSLNLRQLLMQPPVKGKTALGLDPAYRTGCKFAVVDPTGAALQTGVIYPAPPHNKLEEAERIVLRLIKTYGVEVAAIGNGTASKETEVFVADLIKNNNVNIAYMVVSEAGASVYSASKLAAQEFPDYDVSLRSAVSIVRRLQDPLAELVKIDPKAIGVGQYQHDMPKKQLDEALGDVVEDCVNTVGVDLNTASPSLLSYVAGVSTSISKAIVEYREGKGAFKTRKELLKVPKLGPKAFEQCAGFLRVSESTNILDNTSVHPESYEAAKQLLTICSYTLEDVKSNSISELATRAEELGEEELSQRIGIGVPTLKDIIKELLRPGRDPRDELPKPMLRKDVMDMADLKAGMELDGTVRNIVDFGCFVDIGVHQDGLVHISQICNQYIKHPSERVKVGDIVKVAVLSVDVERKKISLTMKV
ncbi:MAG: RNA-binding transcriptional accessory protein [Oscillospiraceae bacterium]|jgi:uncharacterized protein|nr:RNA-binding transcriptional accessory protein [Oscillospiraceae bacterium]